MLARTTERGTVKISELSAATDVPVGTIKYYLREGLLPPGERTSRTTARYDQGHVQRLRLVRALTDAGGLGITQIKRVVAAIDAEDPPRLDVLATAQDALVGGEGTGWPACEPGEPGEPGSEPDEPDSEPDEPAPSRARAWASRRGWFSYDGDRVIEHFDAAWAACEEAGIEVDEALMDQYADAAVQIARVDVDSIPPGADDAVRRVIVGTVMLEPVLAALRLLAQRQLAVTDQDAQV